MNLTNHFSLLDFTIILALLAIANIPLICRFKIKFEEALPTTISLIVIWLYFFGLIGYLNTGFYVLSVVIATTAPACLYFSQSFKNILKNTLTPGFFIYIIWLLLVFLTYSNLNITHHDDFSHWGLASKNTYLLNAIAVGDKANTIFQDYPPGTALLSYWLLKLKGVFSEPIVLFSMSIWGYAVIAYPIKYLEWKNYKTALIYAFAGFFIPVAFSLDQNVPMDYHTYLMVDYLLALIFGYALILAANVNHKYTPFDLIKLTTVIFALVLIKQAGVYLSLAVIALSLFNINRTRDKPNAHIKNNNGKLNLLKINPGKILAISITLSLLIAYASWKFFLNLNTVAEANIIHNFSAFMHQLITLNVDLPERSFKVLTIYLNALYKISLTSGPIKISFAGFCCLIIFGIYIFYQNTVNKNSQRALIGNSVIIFIFLITYIIAHLTLYAVVLSDGEAYGLSSFLRYLLYFTAGMFVFILGTSMKYGFELNNNNYKYLSYLLMLLLFLNMNDFKKDKEPDLDSLKKEVSDSLKKDSTSNIPYLSKWAQLELEKTGNGDFSNTVDIKVIEDINKIKAINDVNLIEKKLGLLEKIAKNNNILYTRGKSLCLFEGIGGSSYGYALMLRNKLAPVHVERILSYESHTESERAWHKSLFILAARSCAQIFLIEPNDVIEKQYNVFFSTPMKNYGLYDLTWSDKDNVKLGLKDCSACD